MRTVRLPLPVLALLLVPAALLWSAPAVADLARGRAVFEANCAACHGPRGHPDPDSAVVQALGVVPADFADALFNSREPESDWRIVVTHGGPALGFSDRMPAFGESLGAADIDAVLDYVKTLGGEHDYPDGGHNHFLGLRTKKAFPEDEWVWKTRYASQDGADQLRHTLEYEWRIGQRWQGVLEASYLSAGGEGRWDVFEPGFKYVVRHDLAAGFIATVGANVGVPLRGDREWEFLPYVAAARDLGDWSVQGHARLKLPTDDPGAGSAEFATVAHWVHTDWPRNVFPGIELVAEVPFDRGPGMERVQWSLIPQARIGLNKRGHVALNVGVEVPLNDTERYDWRGYLNLIWDFADGGFFEGW